MQHRARSHRDAHADGLEPHSGAENAASELVTTPGALANLVDRLRQAGGFAYDSEFIGEQSYIPKLCLIQVATANFVALIDPFAQVDLKPFWELVCDPSVEKVVHAGQQDVEPIFRAVGRSPANLFDTQIAAGMVGLPYPLSLTKLVQELVGVRLGKGLTFTNWDQRPLSAQQLRYAGDDVRYLAEARAELGRRLDAASHAAWAAEESNQLCRAAVSRFDPDETYLKIRGAAGLEPRYLAVLRQLAIWRDAAAQRADVPPRSFLKDEILLALARSPAKSVEKLSQVRGLPRPVEAAEGEKIVAVTLAALSLPAGELPHSDHSEPSPPEKFKCDALWAGAQAWCYNQGLDPNLVSSRQEVSHLRRKLQAKEAIDDMRVLTGWRRSALGNKLLELAP